MRFWFGLQQQQQQDDSRILSEICSACLMMSFVLLELVPLAGGCWPSDSAETSGSCARQSCAGPSSAERGVVCEISSC